MSVLILQCSRCKDKKPSSEFHRSANIPRGFAWECKLCRSRVRSLRTAGIPVPPTIGFVKKHEANISADSIPETELAYIAGLVDAEGSITICNANSHHTSRLQIYNNDRTLLEFVHTRFGGRLFDVKRKKRENCIEKALFFESQSNVKNICSKIATYLKIKKEQCELVLKAIDLAIPDRAPLRERIVKINQRCQPVPNHRPPAGAKRDLRSVKSVDWAYMAGWADGDSTFQLQPQYWKDTTYYYPWLLIFSTKREALEYMYECFGGTLKFRSRENKWSLEGSLRFEDQEYTPQIFAGILPYMKSKHEQCQLMLDALKVSSTERADFRKRLDELNARFKTEKKNDVDVV